MHKIAQSLGLPFHLRTLRLDQPGNLEQQARQARYAFFRDLIRENAIQKVAVGHTRSDQAETVLYRLLRGAGSADSLEFARSPISASSVRYSKSPVPRSSSTCGNAPSPGARIPPTPILVSIATGSATSSSRLSKSQWNPEIQQILAQSADWAWEEEQYWRSEIKRLAANWLRSAKAARTLK